MTDPTAIAAWLIIVFCAWQAWYVTRAWRVWRRLRGDRIVTCPETGWPAAVRIDVPHAAASALLDGAPAVRLEQCSRWPSRGPCDEPCLHEALDPASHVTAIVARWYDGRVCAYCGHAIADVVLPDHEAALVDADGRTFQWNEIPPEGLPETLRMHRPVCWNCHVAETFRLTHPELVTDRERH